MMVIRVPLFTVFLFVMFCFVACSNSDSPGGNGESNGDDGRFTVPGGMVFVPASGNSVYLGTSAAGAPVKEFPAMRVDFTYDYAIAESEVTRGEFYRLLGRPAGVSVDDSLPVTSVTYFDAVLFANAKSVSESMDTAYTYTAAQFDSLGSCTSLEGLTFHPEVRAYRLPTEAEWIFAAVNGWNVENSWNGGNSGYERHKVCSLQRNALGLCDMEGNVREWVQDWFSYLADTAYTNFVGGKDGGRLGERVIKGGYYGSDPNHVSYVSRGDVYTVFSANRYAYLGFRLCYGAIPDAEWSGMSNADALSNIKVVATGTSLKPLTGTYNMRLAFRNDVTGNLVFVNFGSDGQNFYEFQDSIDVYHPEISPDGNWVAFSTKFEGVSGKSNLYVRYLNEDSVAVHRLDVESAAIPRWRVLPSGDTAIVYVTDAGVNSDEVVWSKASTWQVVWSGGKFGTPEKLFDGAYRDGVSAGNTLAVSGARTLRVRRGGVDTVWFAGEQACNASLSEDGSNRILFLDFDGAIGHDLVGRQYATHEYVLVTDSLGSLVQYAKAPEGFTFDHTEWAYKSGLVVATLADFNGSHTRIVLVNLSNNQLIELASGTELWHPTFWMHKVDASKNPDFVLDPDSAGVYYVENGSSAASILRTKMELFWRYRDTTNLIVLGSSRPSTCVDPLYFSDSLFAVNMSTVPNTMEMNRFLFENYVLNHMHRLKYLITSLDLDLWWRTEEDVDNFFFAYEYKSYPGFVYDENHDFWKDGYPENLLEYTENGLYVENDKMGHSYHRGVQLAPDGKGWLENPPVDFDSTWLDNFSHLYRKNLESLKRILGLAKLNGVNVVGIIFPQSPGYRKTGSFGRYGIRRSEVDSLMNELHDLEKVYDNFRIMDENKMGNHDYPDSLAVNHDHLLNKAAKILVPRIENVLKEFKQ